MTVKLFTSIALAVCVGIAAAALAREPAKRFTPLLATSTTVLGEPIVYPAGTPKLTTGILTMDPGDETGWHTHGIPLTGLVLDGEMTVDYGPRGTQTFKAGDSIAEAIDVPHNGRNSGTGVLRLFVVFIGIDGVPTSKTVKPPQP